MRRVAIIADIHADLEALEQVLAAVEQEDLDAIWCLGDVIGRGAKPIECLELVFARCERVLLGNHESFQLDPGAQEGDLTDWGRQQFEPTRKLLAADPRWPAWREQVRELKPLNWEREPLFLVHASPAEPLWHNLDDQASVFLIGRQLPAGTTVIHGHTHFQSFGSYDPISGRVQFTGAVPAAVEIQGANVRFLNPGTVGLSKVSGRPLEWAVLTLDAKERPTRFEWRRTARS